MSGLRYSFILVFLFLLLSCGNELEELNKPEPQEEISVETIVPNGDENYLNENSDYIFDQDRLPTFELNLPVASLRKLDNDPAAEEYVEGSLTFEGETISPVGIRYKGSIGAFVGCLSDRDWTNPSGFKICSKLSMKVKINWEGRDEKFYGLKKLQLHSQNQDDSQMRERLGYWLFRQMGVAAPRSVHARLMINGEYAGLFALTEQIDGRFTRFNWDDGKGNLYKEIWPLDFRGNIFSDDKYKAALKTNEDENPSVDLIRSLGEEIVGASDEDLKSVIDKWMVVDNIISYAVVDRTIRNDDGAFHWYCQGESCSNHNYYWYEETSEKKLHLIPWDLDNAFENIVVDRNPVTPIADAWGEIRQNCNPFEYGTLGAVQRSASCDRLTYAWTLFDREYEIKLKSFKEGPFAASVVNEKIDKWAAQILDATKEAENTFDDAVSVSEWERELRTLKSNLDWARLKQ